MKCESCGAEMSPGFPAVRHDGSAFNLDFIPGDLEFGMSGATGVRGRTAQTILAAACESCGRVEFFLRPKA